MLFTNSENVALLVNKLSGAKRSGKQKKNQIRKLFRMEQRSLQTFLILGI